MRLAHFEPLLDTHVGIAAICTEAPHSMLLPDCHSGCVTCLCIQDLPVQIEYKELNFTLLCNSCSAGVIQTIAVDMHHPDT